MKKCTYCGKEVCDDEATACPLDGQPLRAFVPSPPPLPAPEEGCPKLYYPVGRAIGFFFFGAVLLIGSGLMLLLGLIGLFSLFGFGLAVTAIFLGAKAIATRKKYPMSMGSEILTFFRGGQELRIKVQDLKRIWFNTRGIDKRVSLALADGSVLDIPVLYGLDELRKKLQDRYGITGK